MRHFVFFCLIFVLVLSGCNAPAQPAANTSVPALSGANTPAAVQATQQPALPTNTAPTTTALPTTTPTSAPAGWIAYTGADGNIWLIDQLSGEQLQVTSEGTSLLPRGHEQSVVYDRPLWSSDGTLLAFSRQESIPLPDRMDVQTSLWVYDLAAGEARQLLAPTEKFVLFSWQPGTHVLTTNDSTDPAYFTMRGQVDSSLARGIRAIDADSGLQSELVPPSRGYHLVNPQWSPDGSRLCFEEVHYMEGRGPFGCYEFASGQYQSWERSIGAVSFSPDGQQIAYDTLTYVPSGEERIYLNNPQDSAERAFGPQLENGYSASPRFSPQGDQIAYFGQYFQQNSSNSHKLYVQSLQEDYPREAGTFESPQWLSWSPDGQQLLLVVGPYDNSQIITVALASGEVRALTQGIAPAWQPAAPVSP
jgi:Tol biopolymer transport system component